MKRLDSIQLLRGFAALAVVVFHIATLSTDYAGGVMFAPFAHVGAAGVDLFFVVSGFIMAATTHDHFDDAGAATRFAVHRISRIYPPYWFVSLFLGAYYLYNPAGVNSKQGGADLLASFLLLPSPLLPLLPVAWTLVHEVFFYAVFFLAIALLPRRRLGLALWAWAVLIGLGIALGVPATNGDWRTFFLHPFNLEFIGGALVGLAWRRRQAAFERRATICVGAAVVAFVAVALHLQAADDGPPGVLQRVVLFGAPALLLLAGAVGLRVRRDGWRGFLVRTGDHSYSLYLVHILLVHLGYRLVTRKLGIALDLRENLLLGLAILAVCIACGWCFHRLVERPGCALALRLLDRSRMHRRAVRESA